MRAPSGEPATPAPGGARAAGGPRAAISLTTAERQPQFVAYLPPGAFGEEPVTASVEPRSPGERGLRTAEPFTRVAGGTVIGNVYALRATTAAGAPARQRPGLQLAELRLRAPFEVVPPPVVARRDGGRWRALPTRVVSGAPSYAARLEGPGEYALIVEPGAAEPGDGGLPGWLVVAVPLLLVAGGVALAGRLAARARG